ncbi:MAG TPA: hypothetical protein VMI12_10355 [Puia sp.]|nr:hypothetical protein [Puia sp.]
MKKLVIGLVSLFSVMSIRANDNDPISWKVLHSFQKEFVNASDVNWKSLDDDNFFQASFKFHGEQILAIFNSDGDLVGTARIISEEHLPIMVMKALASNYEGYTVKQTEEYTVNGEAYYEVTMMNPKEMIVVKFFADGSIDRVKKIKNKK